MTEEQIARFWSQVRRGRPDECWIWTGTIDADGYGKMSVDNRDRRAHRLAVIIDGREIPDGHVVDHACRCRSCVNPKHLRAVTRRQNVHENSISFSHLHSLKTHCPQGHPYSGSNLLVRKGNRRGCRECQNAGLRRLRARRAQS